MATRTPTRPRGSGSRAGAKPAARKPAARKPGRPEAGRPQAAPGRPAVAGPGAARPVARHRPPGRRRWPAGSAAAPATSTRRTAATASAWRCSAWPPSWRRSSGGTCRAPSARSCTPSSPAPSAGSAWSLPLVLLGLGVRILRHPQDAEAGGRIGIGLGALVLARPRPGAHRPRPARPRPRATGRAARGRRLPRLPGVLAARRPRSRPTSRCRCWCCCWSSACSWSPPRRCTPLPDRGQGGARLADAPPGRGRRRPRRPTPRLPARRAAGAAQAPPAAPPAGRRWPSDERGR